MKPAMKNRMDYLNEHYSPKATRGYHNMIRKYETFMQEKAITALYADVMQYMAHLRSTGLHPKSLMNHLFAIKIYYRYLIDLGIRENHPCERLYLKDQINKSIAIENLYTPQQLEELLQNHKSKNQLRDEIIIGLLIYQALAVQEIVSIKVKDIKLEEATIYIGGSAKVNSRTLALKAKQILVIHDYLKLNKDNSYLFEDQNKNTLWPGIINRIVNEGKSKSEKLLPLKIRQSVIMHLLKQNNDIRIVQVFAGHKRSGSTEQYKQSGLEELKASIERLHPLQ